jgi:F0F1-type ATP synthase gamma subunit
MILANFAAFEIDDAVLGNMKEYALANTLYWALAEGHACEQSARRNAMDVSILLAHDWFQSLTR